MFTSHLSGRSDAKMRQVRQVAAWWDSTHSWRPGVRKKDHPKAEGSTFFLYNTQEEQQHLFLTALDAFHIKCLTGVGPIMAVWGCYFSTGQGPVASNDIQWQQISSAWFSLFVSHQHVPSFSIQSGIQCLLYRLSSPCVKKHLRCALKTVPSGNLT